MRTITKNKRIIICTMAMLLPVLLAGLIAHGLAAAESGKSAASERGALVLASGITSDDFNSCDLNTGLWTFVNPLDDSSYEMVETFTSDAALAITVPGGNDKHSISTSNTNAPRMMQAVSDGSSDFEVQAKFTSAISQRFQVQGILVEGSGTNEFIRFEFHSDGSMIHVFAATLAGSSFNERNDITITVPGPDVSYYLRVERSGNDWIQSYRMSSTSWTNLDAFSYSLNAQSVGPYAGNSGNPPTSTVPAHTAVVDYFFNNASPVNPEDEDRNTLNLDANPAAGGSVGKNPDKSNYACNESVQITASPNEGWEFTSWSGDNTGATNPDSVDMIGSRQITANFGQIAYTLDTSDITGKGKITREPDESLYTYGDVVTLTAVPNPGWSFVNWGGDLSGGENPATLTITGNLSVSAAFLQNVYSLDVNVEEGGSVAKEPDQASYLFGDVVTVTAVADPGWTFTAWSGDLLGSANPEFITMSSNKIITASFSQDVYTLDTSSITGNGAITREPDKSTYTFDEVVTLTAVPDQGWSFVNWGGDLSGGENPTNLTITGNRSVSATFLQDAYSLDVNVEGGGSVTKEPDQASYLFGDVVTVTAMADPGWTFIGWGGDLSGSESPKALTMTGNLSVSATFLQNAYSLDVNVEGGGSVAKEPDQSSYLFGDVVTITAVADPGWTFIGWGGDLSGSENPKILTMTGDLTVTGIFQESEQPLFHVSLPMIVKTP